MDKRLNPIVAIVAIITLTLGCSLTAPRAAVIAAQPAPLPTPTNTPEATQRPAQPTTAPNLCIVTAQALNVRLCAGVACPVIAWLRSGQVVTVAPAVSTETIPGWTKLQDPTGWVNSDFINCEKNHE